MRLLTFDHNPNYIAIDIHLSKMVLTNNLGELKDVITFHILFYNINDEDNIVFLNKTIIEDYNIDNKNTLSAYARQLEKNYTCKINIDNKWL